MTQGRPVDVRREPRTPRPAPGQRLEAGDFAEVLALDEIRATLDADRIHDGLKFLRPMEQHCGRTFRVMKRVRYVFDERERRMRKSRSVVLLDGVMCDGAGMYGREGCDRSCFFFWKEAWLRKVDPPSGGGSGT